MRKYSLLILCAFFVWQIVCVTYAICPSIELLLPCACTDDNIWCGGNRYYDLRVIFTSISDSLNDTDKHFKQFYFNNTIISEFGINLFHDLTFEDIHIEGALNLTKINTHAFKSTNGFVKVFRLLNTPYNINADNLDHNNIFNAINSMINIESITMSYTALTTLPSNSFTVLNKLKNLCICSNANLKTMGNNAFYELSNLETLAVDVNAIEVIPDFAYNFRNKGKQNLVIWFGVMPNLTNKSFSSQTFAHINPPFELRFVKSNGLKYLDRIIFGTVLSNGNTINFYYKDMQLECDCRMYSIYENREHYEKQVLNSNCTSDGQSLFSGGEKYYNCVSV